MDGSDDEIEEPPFSPRQLGDIVLSYYRFLTTLTFNPKHLHVPPESGWPELTDDYCAHFKSPYALETLRHLPFWASDENYLEHLQVHEYKGLFVNYLALQTEGFAEFDTKIFPTYEGFRTDGQDMQDRPDRTDCILLAIHHSTLGVGIVLDTKRGIIYEDAIDVTSHDVEEYFQQLRHKFNSLQLIPGCVLGDETFDGHFVDETTKHITEQDVLSQQGEMWGTILDRQFVRQIYRQYGWPHQFRKEEASATLEKVIRRVETERKGTGWPSLLV